MVKGKQTAELIYSGAQSLNDHLNETAIQCCHMVIIICRHAHSVLKVKPLGLLLNEKIIIKERKSNIHFLSGCKIVKAFLNLIGALFNLLN